MLNVARLKPHESWVAEVKTNGKETSKKGLVVVVDVLRNEFNVRFGNVVKARCRPEEYVEIECPRK